MNKAVLALPLAAALAVGGSAQVHADAFKPSKTQQVELGKRAASELRRKERVLPSSDARVQTLRRVANRLLSTYNDRNEPWEFSFDVIDKKDVNAFALPGGPTFFYTGILDKMKTEDELAGVLAHEIAHIQREHWAYAYADSQKRNLGLGLLLSLFRVNRTVASIASITNQVVFDLPYSRRHETDADDIGFNMMVRAGYNPQGMVDVFAMLGQQSRGGRPPEWLSTHPNEANRVTRLQNKIRSASTSYPQMRPLRFNNDDSWSRSGY